MPGFDYDEAIKIAKDIYWVGRCNGDAGVNYNPYLIVDGAESILIDPGPMSHLPTVARKILSLVHPGEISHVILSHQGPDVCSGIPVLEELIGGANLKLVAHEKAAAGIGYYGTSSDFLCPGDSDHKLVLKSGREMRIIFTPYSHSPGSIVIYDTQSKILFSSSIFSGMSAEWELFGDETYKDDIIRFAQGHFPPGDSLKRNLSRIESLDISMIAPQHGSIIGKEEVYRCIELLKGVECGIDLQETADIC